MKHTDNLTENVKATAEPAAAEQVSAASVPDKFKDVQTLVKAYTELEAEFTRRSQRLKDLEAGNKEGLPPDGAEGSPSHTEEELIKSALSNAKVREAVISDYLKNVACAQEVPLTTGGGGVAAPRTLPKTVKEAGALAKQFLK